MESILFRNEFYLLLSDEFHIKFCLLLRHGSTLFQYLEKVNIELIYQLYSWCYFDKELQKLSKCWLIYVKVLDKIVLY